MPRLRLGVAKNRSIVIRFNHKSTKKLTQFLIPIQWKDMRNVLIWANDKKALD